MGVDSNGGQSPDVGIVPFLEAYVNVPDLEFYLLWHITHRATLNKQESKEQQLSWMPKENISKIVILNM